MRAVRLSGARPRPKRCIVAGSMSRRLRYSRASAPAMPCSWSEYHSRDFRHDVSEGRGAFRPFTRLRVGGWDFEPGLGRELLDGVHELHSALVGEEADRVAVRAAAEAMVEALVVVDGEARRLLIVERAARLPLAPGADQLHRRRDDADSTVRARSSSRKAVERVRRAPYRLREGVGGWVCRARQSGPPLRCCAALPLPQAVGVVA